MLLTPIGTRKNAGTCLCEPSVVVGVDVFHAFINKVQVDFMTGIKGRARKAVNSLSAGV